MAVLDPLCPRTTLSVVTVLCLSRVASVDSVGSWGGGCLFILSCMFLRSYLELQRAELINFVLPCLPGGKPAF